MDTNRDIEIFEQICQANGLDPEMIRKRAMKQTEPVTENKVEDLIRTAFNYKAQRVVKDLDVGSTSYDEKIKDGAEYTINPDPAAPSFTINEDFIHGKYSESEAERLIAALGKVLMPVGG